jgi:hypothetical protein
MCVCLCGGQGRGGGSTHSCSLWHMQDGSWPRACVRGRATALAATAVPTRAPTRVPTPRPTRAPTRAPTFIDGTLASSPADANSLHASRVRHYYPKRHGLVAQGPMVSGRRAATNAPPATFAFWPRSPAGALLLRLACPTQALRPRRPTRAAATPALWRAASGV